MSGHSKWSTIKRQKGAADVKRGAVFTKIANAVTIAVKQGGGISDPDQNPRLRLAIELARSANMPKENIERAILRAKNKGEGSLEEVVYEGFAPGGVSVIAEAATDNTNRTTSEIKSIFNKNGVVFARPGSASYLFKQVGEITLKKGLNSLDDIFLLAADFGAEDIEERGEDVAVLVDPALLSKVKGDLAAKGIEIISADISLKPLSKINLDQAEREKTINFLSVLEDLDDVLKVHSNIAL